MDCDSPCCGCRRLLDRLRGRDGCPRLVPNRSGEKVSGRGFRVQKNGSARYQGTHRAAGIEVWVPAVLQRHMPVLHRLVAGIHPLIVSLR